MGGKDRFGSNVVDVVEREGEPVDVAVQVVANRRCRPSRLTRK